MKWVMQWGPMRSNHPLRIAYAELGVRLIFQFAATTLLLRSLSKAAFAEYSFSLMAAGYLAIVINATFDSLLNRSFGRGGAADRDFYPQSFRLKIALFTISSPAIFLAVPASKTWLLLSLCLAAIGLVAEHQDVKLRYDTNYSVYPKRVIILVALSPLKLYLCAMGSVTLLLAISLIEVTTIAVMSAKVVKIGAPRESMGQFIGANRSDLFKSFASAFLIFSFFRLDQFTVYAQLGRQAFANYALSVRFNELANSLVGVFARYRIPSVYASRVTAKRSLFQLLFAQLIVGVCLWFAITAYVSYLVPDYEESITIFPVLVAGGLFLIFGQLRGVLFVKENLLAPDILNAAAGIGTFIVSYAVLEASTGLDVAFSYLIAFAISGFVSTFFYRRGREFIREILRA